MVGGNLVVRGAATSAPFSITSRYVCIVALFRRQLEITGVHVVLGVSDQSRNQG